MFIFGFFSAFWLGANKLVDVYYYHVYGEFNRRKSLVLHSFNDDEMGTLLFVAGFLGELVIRQK